MRLGDIATVQVKRGDRSELALQNGNPAIGIQIMKENDANVLETLNTVKAEIASLRDNELKGMGLSIAQSFDPSVFIGQAIDMVTGNLFAGILLAVAVLWYFVRDRRATLLVGLSIPICLTVTLVMLYAFGRTLNVISLAGLAFGVGQSLDTAIVMLEAIAQQREQGPRAHRSHARRCQAGLARAARQHRHRRHRLPAHRLHARRGVAAVRRPRADDFDRGDRLADRGGHGVAAGGVALAEYRERAQGLERQIRRHRGAGSCAGPTIREAPLPHRGRVVPRAGGAHLGAAAATRLPAAGEARRHRRLHPAAARHQHRHYRARVRAAIRRTARAVHGGREAARTQELLRAGRPVRHQHRRAPAGSRTTSTSSAGSSTKRCWSDFPTPSPSPRRATCSADSATAAISTSSSSPPTFPALLAAARTAEKLIQEKMPGAQVQAFQGLEMAEPELRLIPDDRRLNEVGWSRGDIGTVVRALGDGMFVGEYFDGERRLDMILRASKWDSPEALAETPIATPDGSVMPLGELVHVESTVGSGGLRRVDGHRTIGLNVSPPKELSLGQAIELLKRDVEPQIRAALPADGAVHYEGNAGSACARRCRTWRRTWPSR